MEKSKVASRKLRKQGGSEKEIKAKKSSSKSTKKTSVKKRRTASKKAASKKPLRAFSRIKLPSVEELLEAGVHFGHQSRRWHPSMAPYIYIKKNNIHILDLFKTEECLKKACKFLYDTAKEGGQIVFVGTKKQAQEIIENEARRCGALYVSKRWLGGTITNFTQIKRSMERLVDLTKKRKKGEFKNYTKKEQLLIDREIEKLEEMVGGILDLKDIPSAVFIVDAKKERTAVREAASKGVPIVALADTNNDITAIDYPICGNDDAIKSIALIVRAVADAVELGYKEYREKLKGQKSKVKS